MDSKVIISVKFLGLLNKYRDCFTSFAMTLYLNVIARACPDFSGDFHPKQSTNLYQILNAKFLIICICVLNLSFLSAQNCQDYDTKCDLTDKSYTKGSISQGLKILNGQVISVVCIFQEGKDNYISVCGEFDAGEIHFEILNYDTKEKLYDNSDDHNKQSISLMVQVTTKVIIQLSAPNAKYSFTDGKCIGLLIAYKTLENKKW